MGRMRSWIALSLLSTIGVLGDHAAFHDYEAYIQHGVAPGQQYKSSPVTSPLFNVDIWDEERIDTEPPYLFFSFGDGFQAGPYIFSSRDLSLVYADRNYDASNNAQVQLYKGKPYFTFWEGEGGHGHAQGRCRMLNNRYEVVHSIRSDNLHAGTDLHECVITEDGTALVTVYESVAFNLTEYGGGVSDMVLDSIFQEIDIETGKALFTWRALDHIPIEESYAEYDSKPDSGWDVYHINTLQKDRHGDYYVSLRHNHALLKISGKDGSRLWQLGGKRNNFTDLSDGYATDFAWQHHTQFLDPAFTQLTLFDNRNLHSEREVQCRGNTCSRACRIELNYASMTARLLQNFYSPTGLLSYAMGGYHTTANGNALIAWGSQSEITEYDPDGVPAMNLQFGKLGTWARTYRVYKGWWEGHPSWAPEIAAEDYDGAIHIYVSWNGATEVKHWLAVEAETVEDLHGIVNAKPIEGTLTKKDGFETDVRCDDGHFVRLLALDDEGYVLGAGAILDMEEGTISPMEDDVTGKRYDFKKGTLTPIKRSRKRK